jgi:hypothetical protein
MNHNDQIEWTLSMDSSSKYPFVAVIIDDRVNNAVVRSVQNILEHILMD